MSWASDRRRVQRATSSGVEERRDLVPERTRLARAPLVGRRLPDEGEPSGRAGAGGIEEVAIPRDRVRPREPGARAALELAAGLVVEERRTLSPARQASLLEAEQEDRVEAAGSRAGQIEDGDTPRLARPPEPHFGTLERREELVGRKLAAEGNPVVELVEQTPDRVEAAEILLRRDRRRRRLEPVNGPDHHLDQPTSTGQRIRLRP